MNEVEKSRIEEIRKLHDEILGSFRRSLVKAIRIGELLTKQQENLRHGEFAGWVKDNLSFTDRTARNYMRLYRERDRLKTETISDLRTAYDLLVEHKPAKPLLDIRPLTEEEAKIFKNYEKEIAKAWPKMLEVSNALRIISDGKLYESIFQTFEEYCESRWDFTQEDINFYLWLSEKGDDLRDREE